MISVGIHSNLVINKVEVSQEQSGKALNIQFKQAGAVSGNLLDLLNSAEDSPSSGNTQLFKFWALNTKKGDGTSLTQDEVVKNINERKVVLSHILQSYMTKDKIQFDLFKGTAVKDLNSLNKITEQAVLDTVVENLNAQFIKLLSPFVKDDGKKLYAKFVRTSKDKNFPKLPTRFLDSQPFLAPMDDQAAKDKVKFSDYEKKNGLDSAERTLGESDATAADLLKQTDAVNSVFGD